MVHTLDFVGKRVRLDGKVLSKFDVAYLIDEFHPHFHATIIMDVYSYKELAGFLYDFVVMCKCKDLFGTEYKEVVK